MAVQRGKEPSGDLRPTLEELEERIRGEGDGVADAVRDYVALGWSTDTRRVRRFLQDQTRSNRYAVEAYYGLALLGLRTEDTAGVDRHAVMALRAKPDFEPMLEALGPERSRIIADRARRSLELDMRFAPLRDGFRAGMLFKIKGPLREIISLDPSYHPAQRLFLRVCLELGDREAALEVCGELSDPETGRIPDLGLQVGKVLEKVGDYEGAVPQYFRGLVEAPDTEESYTSILRMLQHRSSLVGLVRQHLSVALAQAPRHELLDRLQSHLQSGLAQEHPQGSRVASRAGRSPEAIAQAEAALERAQSAEASGRIGEAVQLYGAWARERDDYDAYLTAAIACERMGRLGMAEFLVNHALKHAPRDQQARDVYMGIRAARERDKGDAREDSSSGEAHESGIWALIEGRPTGSAPESEDEAEELLSEALSLLPQSAPRRLPPKLGSRSLQSTCQRALEAWQSGQAVADSQALAAALREAAELYQIAGQTTEAGGEIAQVNEAIIRMALGEAGRARELLGTILVRREAPPAEPREPERWPSPRKPRLLPQLKAIITEIEQQEGESSAIQWLDAYIAQFPDFVPAKLQRCLVQARAGRIEEALKSLEPFLEPGNHKLRAVSWKVRAEILLLAGRAFEALKDLDEVVLPELSGDAEARADRARAAEALRLRAAGYHEVAESHLDATPEWIIELCRQCWWECGPWHAAGVAERFLNERPWLHPAQLELARYQYLSGDRAAARQILEGLMSGRDPGAASAAREMFASLLEHDGDLAGARRVQGQPIPYVFARQASVAELEEVTRRLESEGRTRDAVATLERYLSDNRTFSPGWMLLARVAFRAGAEQVALNALHKAVQTCAASWLTQAVEECVELLALNGKLQAIAGVLEGSISRITGRQDAREGLEGALSSARIASAELWYATVLEKASRKDLLRPWLEASLSRHPESAELRGLALRVAPDLVPRARTRQQDIERQWNSYRKSQRVVEGLSYLRQQRQADPKNDELLRLEVEALRLLGERAEGRRLLQDLVARGGRHEDRIALARWLEEDPGQLQEALVVWRELLAVNPFDPDVHEALRRLGRSDLLHCTVEDPRLLLACSNAIRTPSARLVIELGEELRQMAGRSEASLEQAQDIAKTLYRLQPEERAWRELTRALEQLVVAPTPSVSARVTPGDNVEGLAPASDGSEQAGLWIQEALRRRALWEEVAEGPRLREEWPEKLRATCELLWQLGLHHRASWARKEATLLAQGEIVRNLEGLVDFGLRTLDELPKTQHARLCVEMAWVLRFAVMKSARIVRSSFRDHRSRYPRERHALPTELEAKLIEELTPRFLEAQQEAEGGERLEQLREFLRVTRRSLVIRRRDQRVYMRLHAAVENLRELDVAEELQARRELVQSVAAALLEVRQTLRQERGSPLGRALGRTLGWLDEEVRRAESGFASAARIKLTLSRDRPSSGVDLTCRLILSNEGLAPVRDLGIRMREGTGLVVRPEEWRFDGLEPGQNVVFRFDVLGGQEAEGCDLDATARFTDVGTGQRDEVHLAELILPPRSRWQERPSENLYAPGKAIDSRHPTYVRREEAIAEIRRHLDAGSSVLLHGYRRVGKSSLLRLLQDEPGGAAVAWVTLQSFTGSFYAHTELLYELGSMAQRAAATLGVQVELPALEQWRLAPEPTFWDTFRRTERALGGRRLLLLIDEFDELLWKITSGEVSVTILQTLRALIETTPSLRLVLAGTNQVRSMAGSLAQPFFGLLQWKEIDRLSTEEARQLIERPLKQSLRWSPKAVDLMITLSAGHPYFLQQLCVSAVNRVIQLRRGFVGPSDVRAVQDEVIEQAGGESPLLGLFEDTSIRHEQRLLLCALAELSTSQVRHHGAVTVARHLQDLEVDWDEAVVRQVADELCKARLATTWRPPGEREDTFAVAIPLWEAWIRRHRSVEVILARLEADERAPSPLEGLAQDMADEAAPARPEAQGAAPPPQPTPAPRTPPSVPSPYHPSGPASGERFVGRKRHLETVRMCFSSVTGAGRHFQVFGPRRTGKTSLLRQIQVGLGQDRPDLSVVFWSGEGLTGEGPEAFKIELAHVLRAELALPAGPQGLPPEESVRDALRVAWKGGRGVVLLLDEFQRCVVQGRLGERDFAWLRSLADETSSFQLWFVLSTTVPLSAYSEAAVGSHFEQLFEAGRLELEPMPRDEVLSFVDGRARAVGAPLPSGAGEALYALLGGHVWLLALAADAWFKDIQLGERWPEPGSSELGPLVSRRLQSSFDTLMRHTERAWVAGRLELLTDLQRTELSELLEGLEHATVGVNIRNLPPPPAQALLATGLVRARPVKQPARIGFEPVGSLALPALRARLCPPADPQDLPARDPNERPKAEWDFFIAYSQDLLTIADELYQRLRPYGRVFFDKVVFPTGGDWDVGIRTANERATHMVALVGPMIDESWAKNEIVYRMESLKREPREGWTIVPILCGRTDCPSFLIRLSAATLGEGAEAVRGIVQKLIAERLPDLEARRRRAFVEIGWDRHSELARALFQAGPSVERISRELSTRYPALPSPATSEEHRWMPIISYLLTQGSSLGELLEIAWSYAPGKPELARFLREAE